jgi:mRNA interferase HigB
MNVVGKKILVDFKRRHGDVRGQIDSWLCEVEEATWKDPNDLKSRYPSASLLSGNIVIFDIKGNDYRIATKVNYRNQVVLIKKFGTHAEYSKWKF